MYIKDLIKWLTNLFENNLCPRIWHERSLTDNKASRHVLIHVQLKAWQNSSITNFHVENNRKKLFKPDEKAFNSQDTEFSEICFQEKQPTPVIPLPSWKFLSPEKKINVQEKR